MSAIKKFIDSEASSGILLLVAAVIAILINNSPLAPLYDQLLNTNFTVKVEGFGIEKPILLWINDGLMAIFFLLVGLELKREFLAGDLKSRDQALLPGLAAFGGIAAPALIYAAVNWGDPVFLRGWAIPAATDIAFALGVLALLGNRVPMALKIFLMTLAILDDLGAILVIAFYYTDAISLPYMGLAGLAMAGLYGLNRYGVTRISPYMLIGAVLWFLVLKSGIHSTLAGVLLALFIPMGGKESNSPLVRLEYSLQPWVVYFIMPVFAFANAGVSFKAFSPDVLLGPLPLGIILGLVIGKQAGITGFSWLAVKMKWVKLPKGVHMGHIYGVSCLAGIGFTMSLFIGLLAFDSPEFATEVRYGVIAASLLSGFLGYSVLRFLIKGETNGNS